MKKIYQVGGCVRDRLLNIPIGDIDFVAVGYSEEDFKEYKKVGKDFPVFLDDDGNEIALARKEKTTGDKYTDFAIDTKDVTLEDDLSRRDLTINSIAYNPTTSEYIDPYCGIDDLKNKILRHTSKAFVDDPLRVLRLARFQTKFPDFTIDKTTQDLIKSMKPKLKSLEPNRVYKEIIKVFELPCSFIFFETLYKLDVLDIIFPNLYKLTLYKDKPPFHNEENIFIHTMMVLKELDNSSHLLKFTALFHDIAKPIAYEKSNFKNCAKHSDINLVIPLIDIQLPKKLKKDMLFLIQNHTKIYLYKDMKPKTLATFIENFRKNKTLFEAQLTFADADDNGRISDIKKPIDTKFLRKIFSLISTYSPKTWIEKQKTKPSNQHIKQHIHKKNIEFIQNIHNIDKY